MNIVDKIFGLGFIAGYIAAGSGALTGVFLPTFFIPLLIAAVGSGCLTGYLYTFAVEIGNNIYAKNDRHNQRTPSLD